VLDNLTYAGNPENIHELLERHNGGVEFWYGDVCNGELVNSLVERADIVLHLAAETHVARSIYDNRIFFVTDVLGTQTVATAVVKNYGYVDRFIHVSSSEVYGNAEYEPMDENHPLNPCSPYAAAKCGADRLVCSFITTYDMPATIIRPFNQYGPYQHLEKVIPRFVTSALKDNPLTIHGTGEARRDWSYVGDLCEILDSVIHSPLEKIKGEIFNIGSGEAISVLNIARLILEIMNKPDSLLTFIGDRPGQVSNHRSSTEKTKKVLGVKPNLPFSEGIVQTIEWFRDHEDWWSKREWMKTIPLKTKNGKTELH
jgi:dTDP-glucose 4,6-dehydratase